jgi:hypothetical protein
VLTALGLAGGGYYYWRQQQQRTVLPAVATKDSTKDTTTAPPAAAETSQAGRGGAQTQPTPADSSRTAAKKGADSVKNALAEASAALRKPLEEFKVAMGSGDINKVRAIWPQAPAALQGFFGSIDKIRATAQYGKEKYTGDMAELEFTIHLNAQMHGDTSPRDNPFRFHAVLRRSEGKWVIEALSQITAS